jgi:adhesin/invasin
MHKIPNHKQPDKLMYTAWLLVFVQVFYPVTSVYAFDYSFSQKLNSPAEDNSLSDLPTHPHTLQKGETVAGLAKRYNLQIVQLKKINQFRLFSRPFEQLTEGDEIDLPDVPINSGKNQPHKSSSDSHEQESEAERLIASNASTFGSAISGRYHSTLSDVAKSQARSAAVSGSQSAVSQWLNQFGTAKVQLGVGDDLSMTESSLDMLIPLYDNQRSLWFVQTGGRYRDQRTTLNLGAGVRFFQGKWMYGANTFFDNDITGHNRRLGVGVELWTDYLRFSGNGYRGLTDWHQSRDFADYDERPADGFDISMSGWLPGLPQLGGKLKYEQYYGNEVALMGKDSRQQNPRAITAGIEYTPVPLITIGSNYCIGSGKNDAQVNVQFKWTPGMSLAQQLSPDSVASGRTLAGSRAELVERNNNIVLDYKKQELIKLSLPERIHGLEGSSMPLNVSVTSKYGLGRIDWQLPADFVAGGGEIHESSKGVWLITLPLWQENALNQYEIIGVAWDQKGNVSQPARMMVCVEEKHISTQNSVFQLESDLYFPADGKTARKLILKARDVNNAPVTGLAGLIHLKRKFIPASQKVSAGGSGSPGGRVVAMLNQAGQAISEFVLPSARAEITPSDDSSGINISAFTESAPGVYEASLTSGTTPGELQLVLSVGDDVLPSLSVFLGEERWLLSNPGSISPLPLADGITAPNVQVSVTDKNKAPALNKMLTIYVDNLPQKVTSDGKGDITVKLPPQSTPGEYSFDIHSGDSHLNVNVTYLPVPAKYSNSVLSADTNDILADGHEMAVISLVLKDDVGNPLPGQNVSFTATPAIGVTFSAVTDHGDGTYSTELRGTQPGHILISTQAGGVSVPVKSLDITLEQRKLLIFKNGVPLQGSPVVGDTLKAVVQCSGVSPGQVCTNPTRYQWEVEASPGTNIWRDITGAVTEQYVVTREMQKRRLIVSAN